MYDMYPPTFTRETETEGAPQESNYEWPNGGLGNMTPDELAARVQAERSEGLGALVAEAALTNSVNVEK